MKHLVSIRFDNGFVQTFTLPFLPSDYCFDALISSSCEHCPYSVLSAVVRFRGSVVLYRNFD